MPSSFLLHSKNEIGATKKAGANILRGRIEFFIIFSLACFM